MLPSGFADRDLLVEALRERCFHLDLRAAHGIWIGELLGEIEEDVAHDLYSDVVKDVADFVEDGVHGVLAPDDDALAEALAHLVLDTPLRATIARHSATTPPPQSWSAVLDLVEAEYQRAGACP